MNHRYCPKWWCGGRMRSTSIRLVKLRTGVLCEALDIRCDRCGWHYEDYRFYREVSDKREAVKS